MKWALVVISALLIAASSAVAEDWEWNSGGAMDTVPTLGGSDDGWGSYFITTVENDTGNEVLLTEFGFPCAGPGPVDWVLWYDVGGINPPSGGPGTQDEDGEFTPDDTNPDSFPPTDYTYIDLTGEDLLIEDGAFLCFGYENPGMGGQIDFNGTQTWAWYSGVWDPDQDWGRTAVLQVMGNYSGAPGSFSLLTPEDEAVIEVFQSGRDEPVSAVTGSASGGVNNAGTVTLYNPTSDPVDVDVEFTWEESANAEEYELLVDDDDDFSAPEVDETGITGESYTHTFTVTESITYYWRVIASNEDGDRQCSDDFSFEFDYNNTSIMPSSLGNIKATFR
jgi:hypothetical protein